MTSSQIPLRIAKSHPICQKPSPKLLIFAGYPVVNDPLYNHEVFGPSKGKGGDIGGKTDEQLVRDLINIHNAENWLGIDGDSELSMFNKSIGSDMEDSLSLSGTNKGECHQNIQSARVKWPLN
jgi:hypothetical protein